MKQVLAFVRHQDTSKYEALGWVYADTPDDFYAAVGCLYRWTGEGEAEFPEDDLPITGELEQPA